VGNDHGAKYGAVEVTRTPDRRFRKPLLYPAELPPHFGAARVAASPRCDKGKTSRQTNGLPGLSAYTLSTWQGQLSGYVHLTFLTMDSERNFLTQGEFQPSDAKPILERLESSGIRFEIQSNIHTVQSAGKGLSFKDETKIEIFIHVDDLERWEKIWSEMFPLNE
jgi:hypothetical protein